MTSARRPGVLFDRDGVINVPPPPEQRYVTRPEDFHLMPGIADAIAELNHRGVPVGVVTNQKCVAIGRLSEPELARIHEHMRDLLRRAAGAEIDDLRYCPHANEDKCACRKPRPGMLLAAARALRLDLSRTWLIGDQERDIAAGRAAGCRTLRVGPGADGSAGEDISLRSTLDLPAWIKENNTFKRKRVANPRGNPVGHKGQ